MSVDSIARGLAATALSRTKGAPVTTVPAGTGSGVNNTSADGHISSGLFNFTSVSGSFKASDVGGVIYINGAAAAGSVLSTVITAVQGPTSITVRDAASSTVTTANYLYGYDDTATLQAAINSATGGALYFPPGVYIISAALTLQSNSTYFGGGSSCIIATAVIDLVGLLNAVSKSDFSISDLRFIQTNTANHLNEVGMINLNNCTSVLIQGCELSGGQTHGIFVQASSSVIDRNYIHDMVAPTGANQSGDIFVTNSANFNIISNNICNGTNSWWGIAVQAHTTMAVKNKVINNFVGAHIAYGIMGYDSVTNDNSYLLIDGNYVADITGSALSGGTGAGIYIANANGSVITNNIIRNCSTATTTDTLGTGGISINGFNNTSTSSPVLVANNTIIDMKGYYGIRCLLSTTGLIVQNNTVHSNTGLALIAGIAFIGCSNCSAVGNHVHVANTISGSRGIYVTQSATSTFNINICSNDVIGCDTSYIEVNNSGAGDSSYVTISDNSGSGGSANVNGMVLVSVTGPSMVTGNTIKAGAGFGLYLSDSPNSRMTNNYFLSSVTAARILGVNTGSYFDKSNVLSPAGGFNNSGTGMLLETFGTVVPTTNVWEVGDRVINSAAGAGIPTEWRCAVAGTPGTWVAVGIANYIYAQPTAGQTVVIADTQDAALIEPAGTLGTLTVQLPTASAAYDGKIVSFVSTQIVTTLTITATAGTIVDPIAALAVGVGVRYVCRGSSAKWYRLS